MDKLLDRLGIYDFFGILIPGLIGYGSTKCIFDYLGMSFNTGLGNTNI